MKIINRALDLKSIVKRKSLFLLGPRQTGKTTLLKQQFEKARYYSLLRNDLFLSFNRNPSLLSQELESLDPGELVIIDEIQKIPELLDEVHYLIEKKKLKFILTGSSARKLRRGGVNLLGGRATQIFFHPLCYKELGKSFDLIRALNFGTLPFAYLSEDPDSELRDYVGLYLKEEISNEGLVRKLPSFSRFLEVAALSNSTMINYTEVARNAQIAPSVCYEYFQILKDTLIADDLPCWQETKKRKPVSTAKFYFFDCGVARILQGRSKFKENDSAFGEALETYIYHELQTYIDYHQLPKLYYWRSTSKIEVDFIFNQTTAIEVKSTKNPGPNHLKGLRALKEEKILRRYILVCNIERARIEDGIEFMPIEVFLAKLWNNEI